MSKFLGFDVGASKTAWGIVSETGKHITSGRFQTPRTPAKFIEALSEIISSHPVDAVGIGIAGTISSDRTRTLLCTNIPTLSDLAVVDKLGEQFPTLPIALDNDARCALIGEVWLGAAKDQSNVVLITLGTGIGGAVMQKGIVRPHPEDVGHEISRIVVDPTDIFPTKSGPGSVESFIGGRNLEDRLQIDLPEEAERVRKGDAEAKEIWHAISYFFTQCLRAIYAEYVCDCIIVGGVGAKDLQYYLQDPPPCPVIPTKLGEEAAVYGAARLAIDALEKKASTAAEWSGSSLDKAGSI